MRRTCPFLLGALLIRLICLGGAPDHLDPLLGRVAAWLSSWLSVGLGVGPQTASPLRVGSSELAPAAAAACLALCPLFQRWSLLTRLLAFAGWSGAALLCVAVARQAGVMALAPGPLLAAGLAALMIGTLTRRASAVDGREHALSGAAGEAALMPALVAQSTAAILTFDCDGQIRSCNRAFGELFGYETSDLVGTSFGRLLDVPDS
jgi:PAS domain-containing protein